jgi:Secretion system C-terminal sorting domain
MKYIKIQLILALLACNFLALAQNPAVNSPQVQPAPLTAIGDACVLSFKIGNFGAADITGTTASRRFKFTMSLSKCVPSPATIASLSGTILTAFDVTYNAGTNTFSGTQKTGFNVAALSVYTASVNAVVTQTAAISSAFIGFNLNIQQAPFYAAANNQSDDNVSAYTYTGTPLNTDFLDFNLKSSNCQVALNWKVNDVHNEISAFEIYKSANGVDFALDKKINAEANKTEYMHQLQNGVAKQYFLIKAIKVNNESYVSKTLTSEGCNNVSIKVYPNPVTDLVQVELNNVISDDDVTVFIRDVMGKLVRRVESKIIAKAQNVVTVDMSDLANGQYTVEVRTDNDQQSFQLSKLK